MLRILRERVHSSREYGALDRNFLAWIRTSVSLLAFGLGAEKFGAFMESLSRVDLTKIADYAHRGSSLEHEGIAIMVIGSVVGLLGFIQYLMRLKRMDDKIYTIPYMSCTAITFLVVLTGILFTMNLR
ncbi:YidH family protein [Candidatus Magnetominusculus dajiuhuensis]|uniref:YidH family protein n=1 Tax=Candidatus Magnetominusculus dajiuhuensis TaxID=3137712 RepID=UPI003B4392B7